jgi:hypothetical protein
MTVSLPGMCHDGIYFSTESTGAVLLSQGASRFYNLSIYDDKCFVLGPQNSISIDLDLGSNDFEDQLFVYFSYTNYTSFSGNSSLSLVNYSGPDPVFLRLVCDDFNPPNYLFFTYDFTGPTGRTPRTDVMIPISPLQVCGVIQAWCTEPLAIAMIVVTALLAFAFLLWTCELSIRRTSPPGDMSTVVNSMEEVFGVRFPGE